VVIVRKVHNYVELAVVNNIQNITTMAKRGRKPKTEKDIFTKNRKKQ